MSYRYENRLKNLRGVYKFQPYGHLQAVMHVDSLPLTAKVTLAVAVFSIEIARSATSSCSARALGIALKLNTLQVSKFGNDKYLSHEKNA